MPKGVRWWFSTKIPQVNNSVLGSSKLCSSKCTMPRGFSSLWNVSLTFRSTRMVENHWYKEWWHSSLKLNKCNLIQHTGTLASKTFTKINILYLGFQYFTGILANFQTLHNVIPFYLIKALKATMKKYFIKTLVGVAVSFLFLHRQKKK